LITKKIKYFFEKLTKILVTMEEQKLAIDKTLKINLKFSSLPDVIKKYIINKIEFSIRSASLSMARKNHVNTVWENPAFLEIYSSISYELLTNLNPDSTVNNGNYAASNFIPNYIFLNMLMVRKIGKIDRHNIYNNIGEFLFGDFKSYHLSNIAFVPTTIFNPEKNKNIYDLIQIRRDQQIELKYSTKHKCNKCGRNKTREKEVNNRCSDEGGSLLIECLNCKNSWTAHN
jgi:DNA-directed RNA polymerase subunit M/transcription elongation factor TFIIS